MLNFSSHSDAAGLVDARDFGIVGDDTRDNSAGLRGFLAELKAKGGVGRLPAGRIRHKDALSISDGTKPFEIFGAGMYVTTLVRDAAIGTPLSVNRTDGWSLHDFGIDGGYATIPTGAGQCFTSLDCNNPSLLRMRFENYYKSAVLMYSSSPADGSRKTGGVIDGCYFDGRDVATNGFLIADMDYSGIRNSGGTGCYVSGLNGPGYALQLKNRCVFGFIQNSWAKNCTAVVAFGNDNNLLGVTHAQVSGIRGTSFAAGWIGSYCEDNTLGDLNFDATGTTNARAILLDAECYRNAFRGVSVANLTGTSLAAVLARGNSSDNVVRLDQVYNPQYARVVSFGTGAQRNLVDIGQMRGGAAAAGAAAATNDTSGVGTNLSLYRAA